jgi:hypothetical protein
MHARQVLAFLDSDDSWLPKYVFEEMEFFRDSQKLDTVYSDALLRGESPVSGKSYFEACPPGQPVTSGTLRQ